MQLKDLFHYYSVVELTLTGGRSKNWIKTTDEKTKELRKRCREEEWKILKHGNQRKRKTRERCPGNYSERWRKEGPTATAINESGAHDDSGTRRTFSKKVSLCFLRNLEVSEKRKTEKKRTNSWCCLGARPASFRWGGSTVIQVFRTWQKFEERTDTSGKLNFQRSWTILKDFFDIRLPDPKTSTYLFRFIKKNDCH